MFNAKIILDSLAPSTDIRITTFQITYPRIVLAEFNTHRVFSRNTASSRAIPIKKMIERIKAEPYVPFHWGKNEPGMQANAEIDKEYRLDASHEWLAACTDAIKHAEKLVELGVHKQIVNRLLECFSYTTTTVTGTEWFNFFNLRYNTMADPNIQLIAKMMWELYDSSKPIARSSHLPYVSLVDHPTQVEKELEDCSSEILFQVSTARCARTSYLTQDGKRDPQEDIRLFERLRTQDPPHASPFEHAAIAQADPSWSGNFFGWIQFRKIIEDEILFKELDHDLTKIQDLCICSHIHTDKCPKCLCTQYKHMYAGRVQRSSVSL